MAFRIFLIGVLTAAALFGVYGEPPDAIRALLAFPYLVVVPGLAWMSDGRIKPMDQFVVSVALTLAMETALGTLLLMCGQWSPRLLFGFLLAATVAGVGVTSARDPSGSGSPI